MNKETFKVCAYGFGELAQIYFFSKRSASVHTTKEGKFTGVNSHAHEVDVIIQVEKGVATAKGRFSAGGRLEM